MKLYCIGLLITFIISGYLAYRLGKGKGIETIIYATPFIWLGFFCCSLIVWLFLKDFREQQKIENVELKKIEIIALNNYLPLQGRIFLATGDINSVPSYAYYYKTNDGGVRLGTLDARFITVFEEDNTDAYMSLVGTKIIYHNKPTNLLIQMFVPVFWLPNERICNTRWTIHVPKGTIVRQVQLDLKDLH